MLKSTAPIAKKFSRDENGNFAMLFGLCSSVLLLTTGLYMDGSRMYMAQSNLTAAMDAAVLATARDITKGVLTEEEARDAIQAFLDANMQSSSFRDVPVIINDIDIDGEAKTVAIDAHLDVPTTFMRIAGRDTVRVPAYTKAAYSNTRIEVAMALDVTGSMGDPTDSGTKTKLQALKEAATAGIDEFFGTAGSNERVRVGLVPYAETVNAAPVIDSIYTTSGSNGCVYERTGANESSDVFASFQNPVGGTYGEPYRKCVEPEIMPLTNNANALKDHINTFTDDGGTAGHIAVAWSQYLLSPRWNTAWPNGSDAADYNDGQTRKYAIIMTDGIFNLYPSTPKYDWVNVLPESRDYAQAVCDEMKANGVEVFTIAFEATFQASQLMDACANDDTAETQYFYDAEDEDELTAAFVEIARDIESLRLTQ